MNRKNTRKFNKAFLRTLKRYDPHLKSKHILHINSGNGDLCRSLRDIPMTVIGCEPDEAKHKGAVFDSLRKGYGRGHPALFNKSYLEFLDENMTPPEAVREQLHRGYSGFDYILSFTDVDLEPANLFFVSRYCSKLIMKTDYPELVVESSNFTGFTVFMDGVFLFHKLPMPEIEIIK